MYVKTQTADEDSRIRTLWRRPLILTSFDVSSPTLLANHHL